jgi:hypothetical protein
MPSQTRTNEQLHPPAGGLRAGERSTRAWRWEGERDLVSAPVQCKREQWYIARAKLPPDSPRSRIELLLRFGHKDETVTERRLSLVRGHGRYLKDECLGWVRTPEDATHLQLHLPSAGAAADLRALVFHPVSERDPKCHPLANLPRWQSYRPPLAIDRIHLPPALEPLTPLLPEADVHVLQARSKAALVRQVAGGACVLDLECVTRCGLTWNDVLQLAAKSWTVVDLALAARLLRTGPVPKASVEDHLDEHGIMSARVEYADVPTRGFALQDVCPFGVVTDDAGFATRVLRADRGWKRYADQEGFATLLASETPDPDHCGDVLSAALPVGRGELILTDLPGLVAGVHGELLAPRVAQHLLRMHLAQPLHDDLQYWNRWEDSRILVRDIADLARRFVPLSAVRWAADDEDVAKLGLVLAARQPDAPGLVFSTGRIDEAGLHDGLPPEPLMIVMKMLAREAREQTDWARRYLNNLHLIWQFDAAAGTRYAANYASALTVLGEQPQLRIVTLRRAGDGEASDGAVDGRVILDEGIHGDGSFEILARLLSFFRTQIEQAVRFT